MSAATATAPARASRRGQPSWNLLLISVLILVAVVLLITSGLLVRLGNDHDGRAILPSTVGAGQSVSGELTLSNGGLLPVAVWLEPRTSDRLQDTGLPSGISISVQRVADGVYLYQGPMTVAMGPLEVIPPGGSSRLRVTVTADDARGTAAVPINFTYFWAAHVSLPWWWWIPTALLILGIVAFGYRRSRRAAAGA